MGKHPALDSNATPEARELERKRAELTRLESELADRELEAATLQNELRGFEWEYFRTVGRLYAELDAVESQIANLHAHQRPNDAEAVRLAADASARATESSQALATMPEATHPFTAGDSLKKLYREAARRIHPDLATNDADRELRTRLMAKANQAYAAGDEAALAAVLDEWQSSPDLVDGDGVGAELVRVLRQIHQVERRLAEIRQTIDAIRDSAVYGLKQQATAAKAEGRDLLAEMAADLRRHIADARRRLEELTSVETPA